MTIQQLRAAYKATPFRPFRIHVADGRTFPIPHPDILSMFPSGRTVIVYQDDDNFSVLDRLVMTELDMSPASASRNQSGGKARNFRKSSGQ
jgi:hypothetical protein